MVGLLGCGCCGGGGGGGGDDPPQRNGCNCNDQPFNTGNWEQNNYSYGHDLPLPESHSFLNQYSPGPADIGRWYRLSRSYHFPTDGFVLAASGWEPTGDWNSLFGGDVYVGENDFQNQLSLNERNYEYSVNVTTEPTYAPQKETVNTNPFSPEQDFWFGAGTSTLYKGAFSLPIRHSVILKLRRPAMFSAGTFQLIGTPQLYYLVWDLDPLGNFRELYQEAIDWGTHKLSILIETAEFSFPSIPTVSVKYKINDILKYQYNLSINQYPWATWFNWTLCSGSQQFRRYLGCLEFNYGNWYVPRRTSFRYFSWQANPVSSRYWDDMVFDPIRK